MYKGPVSEGNVQYPSVGKGKPTGHDSLPSAPPLPKVGAQVQPIIHVLQQHRAGICVHCQRCESTRKESQHDPACWPSAASYGAHAAPPLPLDHFHVVGSTCRGEGKVDLAMRSFEVCTVHSHSVTKRCALP